MKLQNTENPNLIADLANGWSLYNRKNNIVLKQYGVKDYEYKSLGELYKHEKVGALTIDFDKPIENLEDGEEYTVKELAGE